MNLTKLYIFFVYIFFSCTITSQSVVLDTDAEKYMANRFEKITSKLLDSLISGRLKIDTLEVKELNIDPIKKEFSGKYIYSKNSYSSIFLEESFIIDPKNVSLICRFSGDFIENDWSNLNSLKLGCVNIKNKNKVDIILTTIGFNKFNKTLSEEDKQILNWYINYKGLFRKNISSSPCYIDLHEFKEYGNYIIFNLNLRLRNFILNGRLSTYNKPIYIYTKHNGLSILKTDTIESIWNYQIQQFKTDTSVKSAFVIQADGEKKYFCVSPTLAFVFKNALVKSTPIYDGFVIYEDFKQYMSESEIYILWNVYKSIYN